jgi:hypothetical protein
MSNAYFAQQPVALRIKAGVSTFTRSVKSPVTTGASAKCASIHAAALPPPEPVLAPEVVLFALVGAPVALEEPGPAAAEVLAPAPPAPSFADVPPSESSEEQLATHASRTPSPPIAMSMRIVASVEANESTPLEAADRRQIGQFGPLARCVLLR